MFSSNQCMAGLRVIGEALPISSVKWPNLNPLIMRHDRGVGKDTSCV